MRRALIVAAVLGLVLVVLWLAQSSLLLTSLTVVGMALAGLLWWWSRRPEAAASLAVVVLTLVLTSEVSFWMAARVPEVDALQLGFGIWTFTLVTAAATWLAPRHPGNRAATLAGTGAILTATSVVVVFAPTAISLTGFVLAAAVVVWRTRRPRLRPVRYDETAGEPAGDGTGGAVDASARARGVPRTWQQLVAAESELWAADLELLGPQRIGRAEVELALRTPNGLIVVETRQWGGRVEFTTDGDYAWDGDPAALTARLAPIVELVTQVRRGYGGTVQAVVVFRDDTSVPDDAVAIDVLAGRRTRARITLVRPRQLVPTLERATRAAVPR